MNVLLDTHAFLWFVTGDKKLSVKSRAVIEGTNNSCIVSAASLWEIAIKESLGKMRCKIPLRNLFSDHLEGNGFALLPVLPQHVVKVATLPFHHRDPFDRLIAAQSLVEGFSVISVDAALDDYGVDRIWK